MVVFVWIALGWIAGFLASRLFHHTASALARDITLGVAGAIAGGVACNSLGLPPATAIVAGCFSATVGSIATLGGYRVIFHQA
jgi:uncharacterized membrane protein YeaQ/YmgE (transglycosylase-associated protein family)